MHRLLPLLVLATACSTSWSLDDLDGDGVTLAEGDCDDLDPTISPERTEVCDGIDNDCDGTVDGPDAAEARTFFADEDGDGFGNPDRAQVACEAPDGFIETAQDCDDSTDARAPGRGEVCDGLDNECNGETDDAPVDGETFYEDRDGDGFGSPDRPVVACSQPPRTTDLSGALDCADDTAEAFGLEVHDLDRDGY